MNFEGFKKLNVDRNTTILQHPKGHSIRIVHTALSPEMRKHLEAVPHFYEGGMTGDDEQDPVESAAESAPVVAPLSDDQQDASLRAYSAMSSPSNSLVAPVQENSPMPQSLDGQGASGAWDLSPDQTQNGSEISLAPSQASLAVSGGSAPAPAGPSGLDQVKAGIWGQAKAAEDLSRAQKQILDEQNKKSDEEDTAYQMRMFNHEKEQADFEQDVKDGHVDPNRYYGKMDTGSKIATAIGLFLGGLGEGLTGHANPMAKFLQTQVENDIAAQKTELGKKENLLSASLRATGNLRDAEALTQAKILGATKVKLEAAAAASQDPAARARAQQAIGELNMNIASSLAPVQQKQQVMQGLQDGSVAPEQAVQYLVPKEHQKEVFSEIKNAQNANRSESAMLTAFDRAAKENTILKTGGGLARTPESIMELKALALPIIHDAEGRVNEFEAKTINDLLPAPGDFDDKIAKKRAGLQTFINQKKATPTANGFGIKIPDAQLPAEIKTMNGINYKKVAGGWKKVQ